MEKSIQDKIKYVNGILESMINSDICGDNWNGQEQSIKVSEYLEVILGTSNPEEYLTQFRNTQLSILKKISKDEEKVQKYLDKFTDEVVYKKLEEEKVELDNLRNGLEKYLEIKKQEIGKLKETQNNIQKKAIEKDKEIDKNENAEPNISYLVDNISKITSVYQDILSKKIDYGSDDEIRYKIGELSAEARSFECDLKAKKAAMMIEDSDNLFKMNILLNEMDIIKDMTKERENDYKNTLKKIEIISYTIVTFDYIMSLAKHRGRRIEITNKYLQ